MSVKAKRSPWILLLWPASLLLTLGVIWTTGYVYWQIRISGAIAELKRGPGKYETESFYADPDLLDIGSRGIPRMLNEYEDALARGDEDRAFAFYCGLEDLRRGADEVSTGAAKTSGSYSRVRERPTLKEMREDCREHMKDWPEYRTWYAPWWKWWDGHELRTGSRRSW